MERGDGGRGGVEAEGSPAATTGISFRQVLVAVDGSEASFKAMSLAALISQRFGSRLLAVSVVPTAAYPPIHSPHVGEVLQESAEEVSNRALERCKTLAADFNVALETRVLRGAVGQTLLQAVKEVRPDLLVMGSSGLSGVRRLLLGSVAESLVRNAECPVLVVK
jgi:nucleotide-binding universal stress UspA family protein